MNITSAFIIACTAMGCHSHVEVGFKNLEECMLHAPFIAGTLSKEPTIELFYECVDADGNVKSYATDEGMLKAYAKGGSDE